MAKSNEKLVQDTLKTLNKDFIVVGETRVRSWHAWLSIGIAVGGLAGVLFVAGRTVEFEESFAQVAPTSGLIGYWKFDEGSGTMAQDYSGNNNIGTLTNGATWTTGKIGANALNFDGTKERLYNLGR